MIEVPLLEVQDGVDPFLGYLEAGEIAARS
jgi:hypothetical protein